MRRKPFSTPSNMRYAQLGGCNYNPHQSVIINCSCLTTEHTFVRLCTGRGRNPFRYFRIIQSGFEVGNRQDPIRTRGGKPPSAYSCMNGHSTIFICAHSVFTLSQTIKSSVHDNSCRCCTVNKYLKRTTWTETLIVIILGAPILFRFKDPAQNRASEKGRVRGPCGARIHSRITQTTGYQPKVEFRKELGVPINLLRRPKGHGDLRGLRKKNAGSSRTRPRSRP